MSDELRAILKVCVEAAEGIRCYPSGAVGFDQWYEAKEEAEKLLGEFYNGVAWFDQETNEPISGKPDNTLG